jgi:protein-tyrosine phosphatase
VLRARQVVAADFQRFGLILTMDGANLERLAPMCPDTHRDKRCRLLRLSRLAPEDDVPDPYHGGAADFERVLDLIEDASDGLIAALQSAGSG